MNRNSSKETAIRISHILNDYGIKHGDYGKYQSSGPAKGAKEGFIVHRLSLSNLIGLEWHIPNDASPEAKEKRKTRALGMKRLLTAEGYEFNELGYIECLKS